MSQAAVTEYVGQRVVVEHLDLLTEGRLVRISSSHLFVAVGASDLACIRSDTVRSIRGARG